MQLKINWEHKRSKHAIEKMWLRGVSIAEVENAIEKGKRVFQRETGLIRALYNYIEIVFDEKKYGEIK